MLLLRHISFGHLKALRLCKVLCKIIHLELTVEACKTDMLTINYIALPDIPASSDLVYS